MKTFDYFKTQYKNKELLDFYLKQCQASTYDLVIALIGHVESLDERVEEMKFQNTEMRKEIEELKKNRITVLGASQEGKGRKFKERKQND